MVGVGLSGGWLTLVDPCLVFFERKWHRFIIFSFASLECFLSLKKWLLKEFKCSNLKWFCPSNCGKCVEVGNLRLFMTFLVMSFGSHEGGLWEIYSLYSWFSEPCSLHHIVWKKYFMISCITRGYPDFLQHDLRLFFFFSSVLWSGCFDKPLCRGWFDGISKSISLPRKTWPEFIGAIFQFQITRGVEIALYKWHLGVHCDFENFLCFSWFIAISKVYLEMSTLKGFPSTTRQVMKKVLRSKLLIEHDWSYNLLLHPKLRMPVVLFTSHICCVYIYICT